MRRAAVVLLLLILAGVAACEREGEPAGQEPAPIDEAAQPDAPLRPPDDADGDVGPQDEITGICQLSGLEDPVVGARVAAYRLDVGYDDPFPWLDLMRNAPAGAGFPDSPSAETRTDAEGRFFLSVPTRAVWQVVVDAAGMVPQTRTWSTGEWGLEIEFPARYETSVRRYCIVSERGDPVRGARVIVHPGSDSDPPNRILTSDDAGEFACHLAFFDRLRIEADGFATLTVSAGNGEPDAPPQQVDPLNPAAGISGTVQDANGAGVSGCSVVAGSLSYSSTRTDANGRFAIEGLHVDGPAVVLSVWARGFFDHTALAAPHRRDLVVTLRRACAVSGSVRPLPNAGRGSAEVRAETRFGRMNGFADVDGASGAWAINHLRPGPTWLRARIEERVAFDERFVEVTTHTGEARVELVPGAPLGDVVIATEKAPLSFVLVEVVDSAGEPVSGMDIRVPGHLVRGYASTDSTGRGLAAVAVPPGTAVRVDVEVDAWSDLPPRRGVPVTTVGSADEEAIRVTLEAPEDVVLHLLDPDGRPFPGHTIPNVSCGSPVVRAEELAGARLELRVNPFDSFVVQGGVEGIGVFRRKVERSDLVDGSLTIRTTKPATLRFRLQAPDGSPLATESFSLVSGEPLPPFGKAVAQTGTPVGTYVYADLVPGPYLLRVSDDAGQLIALRAGVARPGDAVDLGVIRAGSEPRREGVVRAPDGRPLAGAWIGLRDRADPGWSFRTSSGPDGSFALLLPSGYDGLVVAAHPGHAPAVVDAATLGDTAPIRLRLADQAPLTVRTDRHDVAWSWAAWAVDGKTRWLVGPDVAESADRSVSYRFTGLPPGPVRLRGRGRAKDGTRYVAGGEIRLAAGEPVEHEFEARRE